MTNTHKFRSVSISRTDNIARLFVDASGYFHVFSLEDVKRVVLTRVAKSESDKVLANLLIQLGVLKPIEKYPIGLNYDEFVTFIMDK